MNPVGIVTALDFEARVLAGQACFTIRRCELSGAGVDEAVREMSDLGCRLIVSWGTAGALSPALEAGDLYLAEQVLSRFGTRFETDPKWCRRLTEAVTGLCTVRSGTLVDSPGIVADPAAKQRLRELSGADAVDMESGPIAEACARLGLPFLVVRSIIDEAGDHLPPWITADVGPGWGRVGTVAARLLIHPGHWTAVARLAGRYRRAKATLIHAAAALRACATDGT